MSFLHRLYQGYYLSVLLALLIFSRCGAQQRDNNHNSRYDLANPQKIIDLPKQLTDISGIAYHNNAVYAIDDDHGYVYKVPLTDKPDVEKWEFAQPQDYEDIVLLNNTFYILSSKGKIVYFPFAFPVKEVKESKLDIKGRNEFEILYYDPSSRQLIMLCKECKEDKKGENRAWAFAISSHTFEKQPAYILQQKDIEKVLGDDISRFKPSAAAVHPLTGEVYIVSSINKLLVVLDKNRKVTAAYPLNETLFKQPEGITFTPAGDMIISNEYAHSGTANLLLFKRK
jgi:hypothetical protein